jgi:hypothetical protein
VTVTVELDELTHAPGPAELDELALHCRSYVASAAVEVLGETGKLQFVSLDEALADLD